ncbi:hypothetical protein Pogu_0750 [Pyrobaculum oguniense TE7]|uniref:Uncharacterized protein n=1 Tax=Pyrobaculum oguniense (strain DSM 13380 / JCM 10595 / TE7) TaxID=698757 RepID=H6Q847_PYROT|nr:hypothetical protein Pogu_0750 [Pyrobaculum oguniense TE7]
MKFIVPWVLLGAGAALLAFAVVNAFLLYTAEVPKTTLRASLPLVGSANITGVPDPYVLGVNAVRGIILLAIGLIGAKLLEIGLKELRENQRESAWRQYHESYQYSQY